MVIVLSRHCLTYMAAFRQKTLVACDICPSPLSSMYNISPSPVHVYVYLISVLLVGVILSLCPSSHPSLPVHLSGRAGLLSLSLPLSSKLFSSLPPSISCGRRKGILLSPLSKNKNCSLHYSKEKNRRHQEELCSFSELLKDKNLPCACYYTTYKHLALFLTTPPFCHHLLIKKKVLAFPTSLSDVRQQQPGWNTLLG